MFYIHYTYFIMVFSFLYVFFIIVLFLKWGQISSWCSNWRNCRCWGSYWRRSWRWRSSSIRLRGRIRITNCLPCKYRFIFFSIYLDNIRLCVVREINKWEMFEWNNSTFFSLSLIFLRFLGFPPSPSLPPNPIHYYWTNIPTINTVVGHPTWWMMTPIRRK